MCKFFSLNSDGKGNPYYFDDKLRQKCLKKKLNYSPDSHTSIADYFGFKGKKEDKMNKYEYNPLTKEFAIDQINVDDDSNILKKFCLNLDFKKIVPKLIIKPIIHPFNDKSITRVTKKDIELMKKWANVWDSVRASVWDSVGDSVRVSVGVSVWASVWDSVRDSVRDSVWDSVRDSVWAYTSSFFNLPKWKYIKHKVGINPYQPLIDLWEKGLVPSYDGKIWRMHGKEGKIIYEAKKGR